LSWKDKTGEREEPGEVDEEDEEELQGKVFARETTPSPERLRL